MTSLFIKDFAYAVRHICYLIHLLLFVEQVDMYRCFSFYLNVFVLFKIFTCFTCTCCTGIHYFDTKAEFDNADVHYYFCKMMKITFNLTVMRVIAMMAHLGG